MANIMTGEYYYTVKEFLDEPKCADTDGWEGHFFLKMNDGVYDPDSVDEPVPFGVVENCVCGRVTRPVPTEAFTKLV